MRTYQKNAGLIRLLLILIVVVIVLSYFNFDLRGIIESSQTKENFAYIFELWDVYVWGPAEAVGSVLVEAFFRVQGK